MAYTEADFERMETDKTFARQYVWQVGQKALLRSVESRRRGDLSDAQLEASFGRFILDNIDVIVR